MKQLPLKITQRLPYSPANFHIHQGVQAAFRQSLAVLTRESFGICYVVGGARAGKTHLSIAVAQALLDRGKIPYLWDGEEFAERLRESRMPKVTGAEEVVVIDDVDQYLLSIYPGDSGKFVHFVEELRLMSSALLLLSSTPVGSLPCDNHVKSRLLPGTGLSLDNPAPEDMGPLIRLMSKQRGIFLSDRKVSYLQPRLPRELGAVADYLERLRNLSESRSASIKFPLLSEAIVDENV